MRPIAEMLYHKGIVFKAHMSTQQKHIVSVNDGVRRFIYNRLVELDKSYWMEKASLYTTAYQEHLAYLKWSLMDVEHMRSAFPWLNEPEVDSIVISTTKRAFQTALKNMYERHTGRPAFKKKQSAQSYQTSCSNANTANPSIQILDTHHIKLPKLGVVRVDGSPKMVRQLIKYLDRYEVRIGTATISRDAVGEYWISLSIGSDEPFADPFPETGSIVGIDMNLSNFCAMSDGTIVDNPRYLKVVKPELITEQRKLSLKKAFADRHKLPWRSKNYEEQRRRVAFLQRKVMRQRQNFEHVISRDLVESQDWIFAEKLNVKAMMRDHHLAGAVADISWSEFHRMLGYKSIMYGKSFEQVPAKDTTQTCSACGYICKDNDHVDLGVEEWTCPKCGTHHIRDLNAACNILMKGVEQNHLPCRIPVL